MRNVQTTVMGPLLSLLLLAGCSAKFTANLTVGGKAFQPVSCRSGEPSGFAGIDLMDDTGTRLRLVVLPSGQADAFVFPGGADLGTELGPCGPMSLERKSSRINGVYNVTGKATLSCKGKTDVSGTVEFDNCH